MVLDHHDDAFLLRGRKAGVDGLDDPVEGVVVGEPGDRRLFALDLHQIVKRRDGVPAARIEPDGGDAEPAGQLEAALRVVDVLLSFGQVGRDEVLMDGQHHQVDARAKRALLEAVDVRRAFLRHLPVQNLDAVEPEARRVVDDVLDRRALAAKVPVRITRDGQLDRVGPLRRVWERPFARARPCSVATRQGPRRGRSVV